MSNYVLLNNVQHANLKVLNRYFKEAGDHKAAVLTFPTEFADIQREFPILLSKNSETGDFQAVALLGIQQEENLFLDESVGNGWLASYVPAILARGPFIIGFHEQDGESIPMVYVDMNSPKVNETDGLLLFRQFGGNSPYLEYITQVLNTIQQGKAVGDLMYKAFDDLGLLESVTINVDLKNGDKHQLLGYYTINEEKLANLSGDALETLNRKDYLQGLFLIVSSMSNLQRLIKIKNDRL
jgi:hypothetical protein